MLCTRKSTKGTKKSMFPKQNAELGITRAIHSCALLIQDLNIKTSNKKIDA